MQWQLGSDTLLICLPLLAMQDILSQIGIDICLAGADLSIWPVKEQVPGQDLGAIVQYLRDTCRFCSKRSNPKATFNPTTST